jgi:DNA-binding SARP family transcriptional activator/TolB-like protein
VVSVARYHLRTLGPLRLLGPDQRVIAAGGKHLLLLCFVSRHAPHEVRREELAALLWGNKDEALARQSLRQAVLRLKKEVGDILEIGPDAVALRNGDLELDLNAFERDIAEGRLADAVARYEGDFLHGQEDAGCDTFRAWVDTERERVRRQLRRALEGLVDDAEARREFDQALIRADRWTKIAPLDETAHHRCIALLQREGNTVDALAMFDEFRRRVAAELEAKPSTDFLRLRGELERTLRRHGNGRASAALRTPVLAGRHAELEAVRAIWSRIADESAIVLIEGEEGAGRTRFIREVVEGVRRGHDAAVVLEAGATKSDGDELFSSARRLLSALADAPGLSGASEQTLGELSALVPSLRERYAHLPQPDENENALAEATRRVLCDIAFEAPVLVAIDDVFRADGATLRLLASLMRSPPPSTLFVLTARPDELARSKSLGTLIDASHVQRVKLQPLGRDDVAAVLSSMLDLNGEREALAENIHAQTGGNPYYLCALVHGFADAGVVTVDPAGKWRVTADIAETSYRVPALVREAVRERLAELSPDGQRLVDVAAVMGARVDPAHLQHMAGLSPATFARALDELLGRRVLSQEKAPNDLYVFTHRIVGRAVYELLPPARRQELHAAALAGLGRDGGGDASARAAREYHRSRAGASTSGRSRRRAFALLAAGVAVLGSLGAVFAVAARRHLPLPNAADQRLVVLEFRNQTGRSDLDALGRIAADWLTQGIAKTALVKVVPQRTGTGAAHISQASSNGADAARVAADLGADVVVWGSYQLNGDSVTFLGRITDARTSKLLETLAPVVTSLGQPMVGVEALRRKTLAALAPWVDQRLEGAAGIQSQPPSYEAYRVFAEGLDYAYRRDGTNALLLFMRAYGIDTAWTLPLLYATGVHLGEMRLGTADSLVKVLLARRGDLSPYDRYILDGMVARLRGDAPAGFAAARALAEVAPRSMWAVMGLPEGAVGLNLIKEALEILASIDTTRGAARDLPGFWNLYSTVLHVNGLYERQLEMGKAIRRRLPEEFRALFWQARSLAALGRYKELDIVLEQGLRLTPNPEWGPHGMRMHVVISDELRAHGHPEKAREILERALRFYGAAPAEIRLIRKHRFDVAMALQRLGRLAESRKILEELLAGPPVMGADSLVLRGCLAVVAAAQGDLRTVDELDRWLRNPGLPYLFGANTEYRARVQAILGNREEAVRLLQQAMAEGRMYEGAEHQIFEYQGLRGYAPFEEWLRPKG